MTRLATPIFDYPHPKKTFDQLLINANLYQHAKNQAISLIRSGYMVDQKILQSDWLRTFWSISLKQKYGICSGTQQII